jgi:hypothetical protein
MKLSSSDRKALVKLASGLPKGSEERKAILSGLKVASRMTGGPPPAERVTMEITKHRGGTLWKGQGTRAGADVLNTFLDKMFTIMQDSRGANPFKAVELAEADLADAKAKVAPIIAAAAKAGLSNRDIGPLLEEADPYMELMITDGNGQTWTAADGEWEYGG